MANRLEALTSFIHLRKPEEKADQKHSDYSKIHTQIADMITKHEGTYRSDSSRESKQFVSKDDTLQFVQNRTDTNESVSRVIFCSNRKLERMSIVTKKDTSYAVIEVSQLINQMTEPNQLYSHLLRRHLPILPPVYESPSTATAYAEVTNYDVDTSLHFALSFVQSQMLEANEQ